MLIFQLAIIIIFSKLAGNLSRRFGQPAVLGKLLVGIVLGTTMLDLVHSSETLEAFSQIGVILLMFIAGLETDMKEFRASFKASAYVGIGGIMLPLLAGFFTGQLLELSFLGSCFLGLLLSATSVSISIQALKEMGQLKTRRGATILGAAVIDDIVVIIALAFLMSFVGKEVNLTMVLLEKVVFFVLAGIAAWKLVPWFMHRFTRLKVSETVLSSALVLCFSFAAFAEYTGVSAIIGAYIAGIAISRTVYSKMVFEKVETIGYSIFVPVFFTYIGITANFSGLKDNLLLIFFFSILAILTKMLGAGLGAKLFGFRTRSAFGIGAAMVSRGEVALIVAKIGLDAKLLHEDLFAILLVVVLVTTIVTPPLMKWILHIHDDHDHKTIHEG